MGGMAAVSMEKDSGSGIIDAIKNLLGRKDEGEIEMTEDKLEKILKENAKEIGTSLGEILKEALAPKEVEVVKTAEVEADNDTPVFKGNFDDAEAVEGHRKVLAQFEARKEHGSDFNGLARAMAEITKEFASDDTGTDEEVEKGDTDEVADLKERLVKAQGKSNQTTTVSKSQGGDDMVGIAKTDMDLLNAGRVSAKQFLGLDS